MKSILEFLSEYEEFEILTFDQDMIFNKPIEVFHLIAYILILGMAQMRCAY